MPKISTSAISNAHNMKIYFMMFLKVLVLGYNNKLTKFDLYRTIGIQYWDRPHKTCILLIYIRSSPKTRFHEIRNLRLITNPYIYRPPKQRDIDSPKLPAPSGSSYRCGTIAET
jgi:hypothetical protein